MTNSLILKTDDRSIFHLTNTEGLAASFLILDSKIGGILVNTPKFCAASYQDLQQYPINYIFISSHLGATDLAEWKKNTNAETIAHENEQALIADKIDISIHTQTKLSRTIDILPLPGRTAGTSVLHLKNLPGVLFAGPALQCKENQWPALEISEQDYDAELKLLSSLNLKNLKYSYIFTDDFKPGKSLFGPDADSHIKQSIDTYFQ
ncbi:MAG: hypothetical protein R3240_13230 [Gammaproteobacteria bacterium]|nr:hypothetical protein [Gammaproteobacteria bacterium]